MKRIGLVDTTFARVRMADFAYDVLKKIQSTNTLDVGIVRRTVPGHKELAVECRLLFEYEQCDLCIVFGWVGGRPADSVSANEAALALAYAKVLSKKHILEVMIFETEFSNDALLFAGARARAEEHAVNAINLLLNESYFVENAGSGNREGATPAGRLHNSE